MSTTDAAEAQPRMPAPAFGRSVEYGGQRRANTKEGDALSGAGQRQSETQDTAARELEVGSRLHSGGRRRVILDPRTTSFSTWARYPSRSGSSTGTAGYSTSYSLRSIKDPELGQEELRAPDPGEGLAGTTTRKERRRVTRRELGRPPVHTGGRYSHHSGKAEPLFSVRPSAWTAVVPIETHWREDSICLALGSKGPGSWLWTSGTRGTDQDGFRGGRLVVSVCTDGRRSR